MSEAEDDHFEYNDGQGEFSNVLNSSSYLDDERTLLNNESLSASNVIDTPTEIQSWMICQLTEDNKPVNILYGQFTQSMHPPKTGWVFLANNSEFNPNGADVQVFQEIRVKLKHFQDDTLNVKRPVALNEDGTEASLADSLRHSVPTRYYTVSKCPIHHVNGRYINSGYFQQSSPTVDLFDSTIDHTKSAKLPNHESALMYRNVRNFYILRFVLQEIPELGITRETCYNLNGGNMTMSNLMNQLAETANLEIVNSQDDHIKDGSHAFKYRFIAMSRAGNKMITMDQTLQVHHNNSVKAELRNKEHQMILNRLAAISRIATAKSKDGQKKLTDGGEQALLEDDSMATSPTAPDSPLRLRNTLESPVADERSVAFIEGDKSTGLLAGSTSIFEDRSSELQPYQSRTAAAAVADLTSDERSDESEEDTDVMNALYDRTVHPLFAIPIEEDSMSLPSKDSSKRSGKWSKVSAGSSKRSRRSDRSSPTRASLGGAKGGAAGGSVRGIAMVDDDKSTSTMGSVRSEGRQEMMVVRAGGDALEKSVAIGTENDDVSVHSGVSLGSAADNQMVILNQSRDTVSTGMSLDANFETQFVLAKHVNYQACSSSPTQNTVHGEVFTIKTAEQDKAVEGYLSAESEISVEVNGFIEQREVILEKLTLQSLLLNKHYMESALLVDRPGFADNDVPDTEAEQLLVELFELMRAMRAVTLDLAEAYATWVRIVHKQQKAVAKQKAALELQQHRKNRTEDEIIDMPNRYCVIIGYRSATELYPVSKPMVSNTKKFSRGYEPAKYSVETKLVGVYNTREEAVAAYSLAFERIPAEKVIYQKGDATGGSAVELCVNRRVCGKHILIRNSCVAGNMTCEQCVTAALNLPPTESKHDAFGNLPIKRVSGSIYPVYEGFVAPYIYKGMNYIDKMWSDLDFIHSIVLLQRAFPNQNAEHKYNTCDFLTNPLLLSIPDLQSLTQDVQSKYYSRRRKTLNKHDLFSELMGPTELTSVASRTGNQYNALKAKLAFDEEFKDNPYNLVKKGNDYKNLVRKEKEFEESQKLMSRSLKLKEKLRLKSTGGEVTPLDGLNMLRSASATALPSSFGRKMLGTALGASTSVTDSSMYRLCFESLDDDSHYKNRFSRCLYILAATSGQGSGALVDSIRRIDGPSPYTASAGSGNTNALVTAPSTAPSVLGGSLVPHKTAAGSSVSAIGSSTNSLSPTDERIRTNALDPTDLVALGVTNQGSITLEVHNEKAYDPTLTKVEAMYDYRGTSIKAVQYRQPNAHRIENVFCRTDEGEWATGFTATKGRNMKKFERAEQLFFDGKKREKERKDLQDLIRKAIALDIVAMDTAYIQSLIDMAKKMRGSVLALDIIQAENALAYHARGCEAILKIQLCFHCWRSRRLMLKIREVIEAKVQKHIATCRISAAMASTLVPLWMAEGVRKRVQYITRPIFKFSMNFSGQMLVISVLRHARPFRKPVDALCTSCRSGSTIIRRQGSIFDHERLSYSKELYDEEHHKEKRQHHKHIHTYHRHRVNAMANKALGKNEQQQFVLRHTVYSNFGGTPESVDHTYRRVLNDNAWLERTPCTCQFIQHQETWLMYVYNPLTQYTMKHTLSVDKVRSILLTLNRVVTNLMSPQHIARSLISSSHGFGRLEPLFHPTAENFSGIRLDTSYSLARLNAAAESSVLPLLPVEIPSVIMKCLQNAVSGQAVTRSSIMSNVAQFYFSTPSSASIRNFHGIEVRDSSEMNWDWQPLAEMEQLNLNIHRIQVKSSHLKLLMDRSLEKWVKSEEDYHSSVQLFECTAMEYEDSRSLVMRTKAQIEEADRVIKRVMRFTQDMFATTDQHERNLIVDDKQAYDNEFEDGHQYRGMNKKRRLERLYEVQYEEFMNKWRSCEQDSSAYIHKRFFSMASQMQYVAAKKRYEQFHPNIVYAKQIVETIKVAVREAVSGTFRTFSMPRKLLAKNVFYKSDSVTQDDEHDDNDRSHASQSEDTKPSFEVSKFKKGNRRLQRIPYNFVFVRDPLERLRIEYRGMLIVLERRMMTLRPLETNRNILSHEFRPLLRCVVVVYLDPLTGYIVLHVGQHDLPVEESVQHINLGLEKKDFSHLTSHGQENDILLRKKDVDFILSQPLILCERKHRVSNVKNRRDGARLASINIVMTTSGAKVQTNALMHASSESVDSDEVEVKQKKKSKYDLPSLRPRSLKACKVHAVPQDKFKDLSPNYNSRVINRENIDHERAEKLLTYLRLQPHTGRPTLGLMSFYRRITYTSKQIFKSLWYNDVLNNTPLVLVNNHIENRYVSLYHHMVSMDLYSVISQFDAQFKYPYVNSNGLSVGITIPTDFIISSLADSPMLLSSFITELITNTYGHNTFEHIQRNIRFTVPSVLTNGWRGYMSDEIPHLNFEKDKKELFTPTTIYRCHRFIDGSYCYVKFYSTVVGDIKILVNKPIDGRFSMHSYDRAPMEVLVTRDELRALVSRIAVHKTMVDKHCHRSTKLLHPNNILNLLLIVTDCIYFNRQTHELLSEVEVEDADEQSQDSASSMKKSTTANVITLRILSRAFNDSITVDVDLLQQKLQKLYEQYNHWLETRKHTARVTPLSDLQFSNIFQELSRVTLGVPEYNITIDPNKTQLQLVPVHTRVVPFLDLNKYYGSSYMKHLFVSGLQVLASKGATLEQIREMYPVGKEYAFSAGSSAGELMSFNSSRGYECLLNVQILTNVEKTKLYVDIYNIDLKKEISDIADPDGDSNALKMIEMNEQMLFAEEDRCAHVVRQEEKQQLFVLKLRTAVHELSQELKEVLMPQLEAQKKRVGAMSKCFNACKEKLASTVYYCLEYHGKNLMPHLKHLMKHESTELVLEVPPPTLAPLENGEAVKVLTAETVSPAQGLPAIAIPVGGATSDKIVVEPVTPGSVVAPIVQKLASEIKFHLKSLPAVHSNQELSQQFLDISITTLMNVRSRDNESVNRSLRKIINWCNECISTVQFTYDIQNNVDFNSLRLHVTKVPNAFTLKRVVPQYFDTATIPRYAVGTAHSERNASVHSQYRDVTQWQRKHYKHVNANHEKDTEEGWKPHDKKGSINAAVHDAVRAVEKSRKLMTRSTYINGVKTTTTYTRGSIINVSTMAMNAATAVAAVDAGASSPTATAIKGPSAATVAHNAKSYNLVKIGQHQCVVHKPEVTKFGMLTVHIYNIDTQSSYVLQGYSVVPPPFNWLVGASTESEEVAVVEDDDSVEEIPADRKFVRAFSERVVFMIMIEGCLNATIDRAMDAENHSTKKLERSVSKVLDQLAYCEEAVERFNHARRKAQRTNQAAHHAYDDCDTKNLLDTMYSVDTGSTFGSTLGSFFIPQYITDQPSWMSVASQASHGGSVGPIHNQMQLRQSIRKSMVVDPLKANAMPTSGVNAAILAAAKAAAASPIVPMFGFFLPQDRGLPAVPIVSNSADWKEKVLYSYLVPPSKNNFVNKGSYLENDNVSVDPDGNAEVDRENLIDRVDSLCGIVYRNTKASEDMAQFYRNQAIAAGEDNEQDEFNLRLHNILMEYTIHLGYRTKREEKVKMKGLLRMVNRRHAIIRSSELAHKENHDASDDVPMDPFKMYGDVVILLRFGAEDKSRIQQQLNELYASYAPQREALARRRASMYDLKTLNYVKYRTTIFNTAAVYLQGAEMLASNYDSTVMAKYAEKNKSFDDNHILAVETRLLLTKFNDLLQACSSKCTNTLCLGGEVSFMQYATAIDSSQLLKNSDNVYVFNLFKEHFPARYDAPFSVPALSTDEDVDIPVEVPLYLKQPYLRKWVRSSDRESYRDFEGVLKYKESDPSPMYLKRDASLLPAAANLHASRSIVQSQAQTYNSADLENASAELIITTGQVVYAMYQLHCHSCEMPLNQCKFPGCSIIRSNARALCTKFSPVTQLTIDSSAGTSRENMTNDYSLTLLQLKGTGKHPIEVSIQNYFNSMMMDHHYMLTHTTLTNPIGIFLTVPDLTSATMKNDEGIEPEEEILAEKAADQAVIDAVDYDDFLRFHYDELTMMGGVMRILHNLLISSTLRNVFTSGMDVLVAKGGINQAEDEAAISQLLDDLRLLRVVPESPDSRSSSSPLSKSQKSDTSPQKSLASEESDDHTNASSIEEMENEEQDGLDDRKRTRYHLAHTYLDFIHLEDKEAVPTLLLAANETALGDRRAGIQQAIQKTVKTVAPKKRVPHYAELPYWILNALLGIHGVDAVDNRIPLADLDPYPDGGPKQQPSHHHNAKQPMSSALFQWLVSHLQLSRPSLLCTFENGLKTASLEEEPSVDAPGTMSRGTSKINRTSSALIRSSSLFGSSSALFRSNSNMPQLNRANSIDSSVENAMENLVCRFDRLHCEKVVTIVDPAADTKTTLDVVVVQVLHGIIEGASKITEETAGIPAMGQRLVSTECLCNLTAGLTLLVYDVNSRVSHAVTITTRAMLRVASVFGIKDSTDYPNIAKCIVDAAGECIMISRVSGYCTGVTFDVSKLETNLQKDSLTGKRVVQKETGKLFTLTDYLSSTGSPPPSRGNRRRDTLGSPKAMLRPGGALDLFNSTSSIGGSMLRSSVNALSNLAKEESSNGFANNLLTGNLDDSQVTATVKSVQWSTARVDALNSVDTFVSVSHFDDDIRANSLESSNFPQSVGPTSFESSAVVSDESSEVSDGNSPLGEKPLAPSVQPSVLSVENNVASPFSIEPSNTSGIENSALNSGSMNSLDLVNQASVAAAASVEQHEGWSMLNNLNSKSTVLERNVVCAPRLVAVYGSGSSYAVRSGRVVDTLLAIKKLQTQNKL